MFIILDWGEIKMPSKYKTKKDRRKVVDGFPWTGKFKTKTEVDKYFSGDRIQCLICGKWYKSLVPSHLRIHNISENDYRERFGLPWRKGLCGCETIDKYRAKAEKMISEGKWDVFSGKTQKIAAEAAKKQRRKPPYQINESIKKAVGVYGKTKPWQKKDFDKILHRMKTQKRILKDVYNDSDLPGYNAWRDWIRKHPKYKEVANKIHYSFPYHLQAKGTLPMSGQFSEECKKLAEKGWSQKRIGRHFGVAQMTVCNALKRLITK